VILFVVYYAAAPFLLAALAYIAEKATQEDEDLAWSNARSTRERERPRRTQATRPTKRDDMRGRGHSDARSTPPQHRDHCRVARRLVPEAAADP
jgi:hypothetical protein